MSDMSNHRFWEFYLVRYLSGAVFGILVIFFLSANYSEGINSALSITHGSNKESVLTVDNFYKTVFISKEIVTCKNKLNPQWICDEADDKGVIYEKIKDEVTIEGLLVLFVIGSLFMYIASIPIYFLHIFRYLFHNLFVHMSEKIGPYEFYIYSNKARAAHKDSGFVSSYKQMREHGNAFGIILMEMLFAFLLVACDFSMTFIVIWIGFGFIGWFLGQRLEAIMIEKFRYDRKT